MKRTLMLTALLAGLGSTVQAAPLANQMPAGALLTLETSNANGLVERFTGLVAGIMGEVMSDKRTEAAYEEVKGLLSGSIAKEAVLSVYTVPGADGTPSPQVLGVSRAEGEAAQVFRDMLKSRPGAKVGHYAFSRQGEVFAGTSGGLVYFSTDKALLMGYLGRLSGKDAPRLMNSLAYTAPTRTVGQQEVSLFMDFSATARTLRSAMKPFSRLLSPVVDALDTLGQYAAGFTTTQEGLTSVSAQAVNPQGRDKPLYNILTHTTEFHVQNIIPADAEAVSATACSTESPAYLARWLTRIDLFDPVGFLTDSQLASHLEKSAQYLGDECAQVTLAGGAQAAFNFREPLAAMRRSVAYSRVRDMDAARAHMPQFAASLNAAIAGLASSLTSLLEADGGGLENLTRSMPKQMSGASLAGQKALEGSMAELETMLKDLKLVYAFRGDYLITAYSQEALQAALDESAEPLGQDAAFQEAGLNMKSAGWSYQTDLPDLSAEDLLAQLPELNADAASDDEEEMDEEDPLAGIDLESLTDEQRATIEEMMAAQNSERDTIAKLVLGAVTDLINRYDGLTSQKLLRGNIVSNKSSIKYRW